MLKLLVYNRFLPEVSLAVLHPFKVRGGYATSVAQNIRDHEHPFVSKNFICSSRSRAVRAFRKNLALHTVGVPAGDLVFGCRRNKNLAISDQQISRIGRFGLWEAQDGAIALAEFPQCVHVDAILVIQTAINFDDANNLVAGLRH